MCDGSTAIVTLDGRRTEKQVQVTPICTIAPFFRQRMVTIPSGTKIIPQINSIKQHWLFGSGTGMLFIPSFNPTIHTFTSGDFCTIPENCTYELGAGYGGEDVTIIITDVPW